MLLFSYRKEIERLFLAWCERYGAAQSPSNVVAFLQANHWLNEEEIQKDLEEQGK